MSNRPTVVILAAGENSRFAPFNTVTHKGALQLLGEPILVRTLRKLQEHEFSDVVIIVSEKDYAGKGLSEVLSHFDLNLKISFVLQPKALGMGDALLCAKDQLGEQFAVISPSAMDACDVIDELIKYQGEDGAILVRETSEPWLFGIVEVENNRIMSITEKPERGTEKSNLKVQTVYLLSRKYIETLEQTPAQEYSFEVALDTFFKDHHVSAVSYTTTLPSLKYPWHLFHFQKELFAQMKSYTAHDARVAPTAIIDDSHGPVIIESGAVIGHAAKVSGPAYIGRHALVGDFSFVRGSSIEEDATIGSYTEVVRCIFFPHSNIHYGYIADSIVGSGAKIGGGLLTANKRHDRENVKVSVKGKKVDSGTNALGILVGAKAVIGVRVTTMPGVMIGSEAVIYPSKTLYENVDAGAVVK